MHRYNLRRVIRNMNLWLQPITLAVILVYLYHLRDDWDWSLQSAAAVFVLSFLPCVLLSASIYHTDQMKKDSEKHCAAYPEIPAQLQRKIPEVGDLVFGKNKRYYACNAVSNDSHYLIIGGSGSGKSSCVIIPCLLNNTGAGIFALDIKGELSQKSMRAGDAQVLIFNPQDRCAVGYDPFFLLDEDSDDQRTFETMQMIAFSLIPMSPNIKDPFWKNSARNLCIGLFIYLYNQGMTDLISIVEQILGQPIRESIIEVMQNAERTSNEYRYIVQFSDMADETLSGIFAELTNAITVFATDHDIQYALRDNPRKLNPHMLEDGYSIFIAIKEEKLSAYYHVLQLILNQTLAELEKRPEDAQPILFVADELPRILSAGKLEKLLDSVKTLRSRRVRLLLVTQSLEALMSAYSENEAIDLISNCAYKIVLDASSNKTQKMICEWAGKYKERRLSDSRGKTKQTTTSYEEKDILQPSDLMTLAQSNELILISPYGYNRLKKCPYYADEYLKLMADEIAQYNSTIAEITLQDKEKLP